MLRVCVRTAVKYEDGDKEHNDNEHVGTTIRSSIMRGQFGTKCWVKEVNSEVVALDCYVGRRKIYASFLLLGALENRYEPKDPYGNQINRLQYSLGVNAEVCLLCKVTVFPFISS